MKRLVGLLVLLLAFPVWANTVTVPLKAGSAFPFPGTTQNFVMGSNGVLVDTYIMTFGSIIEWQFSLPDTYDPSAATAHGNGACNVEITWWPQASDIGGGCWMASITAYPETNVVVAPTPGPFPTTGDNWLLTYPQNLIEGAKQQLLTPVEGHPYLYHLDGIVPQDAITGNPCSQDGTLCVGASTVLLVSWDIGPSCVGINTDVIHYSQEPRIKRVKITCPSL